MKPIGYWLNRTDRALTLRMDELLADHDLTRLGWQLLGSARESTTDRAVHAELAANATPSELTETIELLLRTGWLTRPAAGHLALTDTGSRCLAEAGTRVAAFRATATAGVSDQDYRTTVRVLERIVGNLSRAGHQEDGGGVSPRRQQHPERS
ncbi:MarR family winged helix-turn-helix transcriptional regulator [Kitasatospora sp. NPDC096147]|uniref:MarR family winged helix-turn-helix transcriptional regulator n=1 Tax=Kitasatospora sp. NPDC096147 TaxID=3364093 RepID=UPI0038271E64